MKRGRSEKFRNSFYHFFSTFFYHFFQCISLILCHYQFPGRGGGRGERVLVINSSACETDEIDICAFPYYKYSSALHNSRIWIPLRNRLPIISYNKSINVEIAKTLVNSICC